MNQAVDLDELTLFRDMARRAFEQEITPHYEAWEEERMVPRTLWNRLEFDTHGSDFDSTGRR